MNNLIISCFWQFLFQSIFFVFFEQLDRAYCELEKRITEHDEAALSGFDRPELTLAVRILLYNEKINFTVTLFIITHFQLGEICVRSHGGDAHSILSITDHCLTNGFESMNLNVPLAGSAVNLHTSQRVYRSSVTFRFALLIPLCYWISEKVF